MRQVTGTKRGVEISRAIHGVWVILGEHGPTGRRFIWTVLEQADQVLNGWAVVMAQVRAEAQEMAGIGTLADWEWASQWTDTADLAPRLQAFEAYDVDEILALEVPPLDEPSPELAALLVPCRKA